MPGQKVILSPCGLYTNVNQLGKIPEGGLLEARNVVISKPGVLQCRRGSTPTWFSLAGWSGNTPIPGPTPLRLFNAKLRVGGDGDTGWLGTATPGVLLMSSDGTMRWSVNGLTFSKINPIYGQEEIQLAPIDGDRHWYGFEQNGTYYVATTHGIIAVGRPLPVDPNNANDLRHAGYYPAGVPAGLSTEATIDLVSAGAAIRKDSQVAYRFCFGYRDENGIPHLGAPSTRAVVINTDMTNPRNVSVKTAIPPGVIPGRHFWQLYRSLPSSSKDVDPGDDEGLIYEGVIPVAANITSASRTTNVATLGTAADHGYTLGQEIRLANDIVAVPPAAPTTFYRMSVQNVGGNTVRCTTYTYDAGGNHVDTAFIDYSIPGYFATDANAVEATSFLFKNSVTGEQFCVALGTTHILHCNVYGGVTGWTDVGFTIDNAVADESRDMIYLIGRPNGSNVGTTFDYNRSAFRYTEYSMRTKAVTFAGTKNALQPSATDAVTEYHIARAYLGLYRPVAGTTTNVILAYVDTAKRARCKISSGYSSWLDFAFNFVEQQDGTFVTPHIEADAHIYGDTYLRGDTGELVSIFTVANLAPGGTNTSPASAIYIVTNNYLYSSKFTRNYTQTGTYLNDQRKGFNAIRCDRQYGNIAVVSVEDNLSVRVHYLTTAWNPVQDTVPVYSALTSLTGLSGMMWALSPDVPSGGQSKMVVDYYNGTTWVAYKLNLATHAATSWNPVNYPSMRGSANLNGGAGNIIPAGIYTIATVPTSSSLTINATGSNFTTISCNVNAEVTSIGFLDGVLSGYIGPYLYTSNVQEGAINANYAPPFARDISLFRTYAFYANCNQPAGLNITLTQIDEGAGYGGIAAGDILYIGASSAIASDTESVQNRTFKVYTALNSSLTYLPDRIKATLESLAKVVNYNHDTFKNTITLMNDSSGMSFATMFLRSVDPSQNVIFRHIRVTSLVSTAFSPYDVIVQSIQEQNVLYYSKSNIPDAVPLLNSIRIGQDNKPIRRIVAARDCMFIFKDDGCFILRGYGPPWQVDPYDLTLQLAAPDTAVVLENAVFGLFTRGVFKVSDSNVELLSLPIQDQLERYMAGDLRQLGASLGYGAADNADRKFLLWLPDETDLDKASKAYVYDTVTETWTVWEQPSYHTICYNEQRLIQAYKDRCYGSSYTLDVPCIKNEQKTLTYDDLNDGAYFGEPIEDAINDVREAAPTFTMECDVTNRRVRFANYSVGVPVVRGDTIYYAYKSGTPYGNTRWSGICLNDANVGDWISVSADMPIAWDGDTVPVNVFKGINQLVQFAPAFPGTPAASNHFSELALSFREAYWGYFELNIERPMESTDYADSIGIIPFNGMDHFGVQNTYTLKSQPSINGAYRTRVGQKNFIRTYIPRDQQRGTVILPGYEVRVANWPVEVDGIYLVMTQGPTSFTRR